MHTIDWETSSLKQLDFPEIQNDDLFFPEEDDGQQQCYTERDQGMDDLTCGAVALWQISERESPRLFPFPASTKSSM